MVLGQVVNLPPSSLFHCRLKIHTLCLWNLSRSLGNTHNNPHCGVGVGGGGWWLCDCWVAVLKPLLKCYRRYFVLKWWMVVGISTRILYVVSVHANSLFFLRRTDNVFKMCLFLKHALFLSFESLGHLVTTEYMLNLVIECEVSLTFNGSNLREYIPGHTHPCSFFFFSFCVKGQYHWISDVIYATPYGMMANHSGLMNTLAPSPVATNDITVCPILSSSEVTLKWGCTENELGKYKCEKNKPLLFIYLFWHYLFCKIFATS